MRMFRVFWAALLAATMIATSVLPASAERYYDPVRRQWFDDEDIAAAQAAQGQTRRGFGGLFSANISHREVVDYASNYRPGTIIVETSQFKLYFILDSETAMQYGIGVGREGFQWAGTHRITRKAEWPGWTPPPAMRARQPELPVYMPGGPGNPLGARALYIGSTLYRLHGTSDPRTIGQNVSSGCIRLTNADIIDLYNRADVGATVIVRR